MKVILMTVILTSIVAIQVEDAIPAAMRKKLGLNLPVVSLSNEEHGNTTFLELSGCWSEKLLGKYVQQQHGKTNECYSFAVAKTKCEAAKDCGAIATQSNVCGGKYRVTHGGPNLIHYGNWKPYNLHAYTFSRKSNCALSNANTGCHGIKTEAACLKGKDGRKGQYFTDSPCDWCCGAACTSNNGNKCEPHAWLIRQPSYTKSKNAAGYDTCSSGSAGELAGEYQVWYRGGKRTTNMKIGCDKSASQPGIFTDRLHFKNVRTKCNQARDSAASMFILKTHGAAKYECLRVVDGGKRIIGSHYTGPNAYWGSIEYKLISAKQCDPDKDAHESIFDLLTDIKKSIQNELVSVTNTAKKRCTDNTKATVVAKPKDFYYDLIGCVKGSECETGTEAQQKLAVDANNDLVIRNAEGEKLDGQLDTLGKQITAAKQAKTGFEKDQRDGDALHKARMAKFQNAIRSLTYLDTCLDAKTGKIACPTNKGTVLLSEEDKNAIGHFKVGKVMLLMLDQALGGVKERNLVNTLKKLLASCIKSLEASKVLEVAAHKKWNTYLKAKIAGQETALQALIKKKGAVAKQIEANNKKKAAAKSKKDKALATLKKERTSCIALHKNYVASVTDHNDETAAIDEMIKILKKAKLNAKTQKIRDEDEKTKHGVQESVDGK